MKTDAQGLAFTRITSGTTYAQFSTVTLPTGHQLSVTVDAGRDRICLIVGGDPCGASMSFTVEQVRSIAAELLAAADMCTHTTTPASLDAFEAWLVAQQHSALQAMQAATGDAFTNACTAFALPTAGMDALHAFRAHCYHLARTPSAANTCGRG